MTEKLKTAFSLFWRSILKINFVMAFKENGQNGSVVAQCCGSVTKRRQKTGVQLAETPIHPKLLVGSNHQSTIGAVGRNLI